MELKNKMQLTLLVLLVLAILLPLVVTVQYLTTELNRELVSFEQEEVEKLRDTVKNFVDIGHEMMSLDYQVITNRNHMARVYGESLRGELDTAIHFLNAKAAEVGKNGATLEQVQEEAKEIFRSLRLQEGQNYIWIQDMGLPFPKMITHPLAPELDGKILDDPSYNCARGKGENLFVASVDMARKNPNGGFIDYLWPKFLTDGTKIPSVAKVSCVKMFPKWNWILGTGIYIDDAIERGISGIKEDISRIRFDDGNGFFWVHDKSGTLICHGNEKWLASSKPNITSSPATVRGLKLLKDGRHGDFLEFKGLIEEYGKTDERIAYMRLFKPLNWVIGASMSRTGMDLRIAFKETQTRSQINRILLVGFLFFLCFTIFSLAIIGRILGPFARLDPELPASANLIRKSDSTLPVQPEKVCEKSDSLPGNDISPELMKVMSEITRHTVSEQSKLLALQILLAGESSAASQGNEGKELAWVEPLKDIHGAVKKLAAETGMQSNKLSERLVEIEKNLAKLQGKNGPKNGKC